MFDLLIRNGEIIDGAGGERYVADLAVKDGKIAAIGPGLAGEAAQIIDADGLLVTPGFIDIHTHYDGQATWDGDLMPSAGHGVTTIVMGSCGVGFAPVRPGTERWLISLMEGVEDIPGSVLHEGIQWSWEGFPQYLDALAKRSFTMDVAAQVPHSAVRAYVMRDRAKADADADETEVAQIAAIVGEGIAAGAVGFGTSRIAMHQDSEGGLLPGTSAAERELMAVAEAMRDAGAGVFQLVPSGVGGNTAGSLSSMGGRSDKWTLPQELDLLHRIVERTGRPVTFTIGQSPGLGADGFQAAVDKLEAFRREGQPIYAQISARPTGILTGLSVSHAFQARPSYRAIAHLPLAERAAEMRKPQVRAAILAEDDLPAATTGAMDNFHLAIRMALSDIYPLGDSPDYEPDPALSVASQAKAQGREPLDLLYELMLEEDGSALLIAIVTNYLDGDLRLTEWMLRHPQFVVGLGDAGAHVRAICDASLPTFMLTHWGRDRSRGPTLPLELLVKRQTADNAALYGFDDRGRIEVGRRADLNLIDFQRLALGRPHLVGDLPAGGQRFLQDATGYVATLVNGVVTRRDGVFTGARPGRLLRGGGRSPAAVA